jgi:hypothetical protein
MSKLVKHHILIFILVFLLFPSIALATIGVGVGTGKIQVEDKLKPGTLYVLPQLTVINTGDEPSEYEAGVSYHEKQPQLMPSQTWFIFSPRTFHLNPNEVQVVSITLNLPVKVKPGDYFAYIEGHPIKQAYDGNTSIGVAAAAKLYFTVVPGSIWEGFYYKIISFFALYSPWPQRVLLGISVVIIIIILSKFFHIQIHLKKKDVS